MTIRRLTAVVVAAPAGRRRRRARRRERKQLYAAAVDAFDRGDMARFVRLFDRFANTEDQ
jgi:hypothetical protein